MHVMNRSASQRDRFSVGANSAAATNTTQLWEVKFLWKAYVVTQLGHLGK